MTEKKEVGGRTVGPASVEAATAPSAAAFTPGPWSYRPEQYDDWGWVRSADGWVVATASVARFDPDELAAHRCAGTDPVEATARLIAAAPELLEACQGLLGYADDGALFSERIAKARAAIAKAEGRS